MKPRGPLALAFEMVHAGRRVLVRAGEQLRAAQRGPRAQVVRGVRRLKQDKRLGRGAVERLAHRASAFGDEVRAEPLARDGRRALRPFPFIGREYGRDRAAQRGHGRVESLRVQRGVARREFRAERARLGSERHLLRVACESHHPRAEAGAQRRGREEQAEGARSRVKHVLQEPWEGREDQRVAGHDGQRRRQQIQPQEAIREDRAEAFDDLVEDAAARDCLDREAAVFRRHDREQGVAVDLDEKSLASVDLAARDAREARGPHAVALE